jgi:RNA polymerase sigma-70 factor, ECF subfamily
MSLLLGRRQERAFERLYRRHVGDVYRYALLVLGDEEHAESVTQASFVRAFRAYLAGERPRNAYNWLLGIAHRVCGRRSPGIDAAVPEDLLEDDSTPTVADIRRALEGLGFDERAVLLMREVEGRSYAEIAEFLDVSGCEVEMLAFRARKALRVQLESLLTCHQAERSISRSLDERLPRSERKQLRTHLQCCPDCIEFATVQNRQRAALQAFQLVPVPESLRTSSDGAVLAGLLARALAVGAIALVVGGAVTGGVDPRSWGRGATRIEPARAAPPRAAKQQVKTPREKKAAKRPSGS